MAIVSCSNGLEVTPEEQADFQSGTYILYRIDGDRYPGSPVSEGSELIHGWEILESCNLESTRDRALVFKAFENGQKQWSKLGGIPVDCFQPRHGIRTTIDGVTTDYLICFQCSNFMIWTNDEQSGGGMTSNSPMETFDSILAACNR